MASPRCTVKLRRFRDEVDAVLYYKGRSINVNHMGKSPSRAHARNVRKRLLAGCRELSRRG